MDITRSDIAEAGRRIAGDVRRTPLVRIDGRALGVDCGELWLKLEHLQVGGSFKARGMSNRMRANDVPAAGVVIASGGNAGIAVAHAARKLGVRCEVFVPESSSSAKREALARLGAVVTVGGASYADALAASLERQAASGALLTVGTKTSHFTPSSCAAAAVAMPALPPEATITPLAGMGLESRRLSMPRALKLPPTCRCSSFSQTSAQSTPNAAPGSFHSGVRRMKPGWTSS